MSHSSSVRPSTAISSGDNRRIEELIADYTGRAIIDEYLRRLLSLSQNLSSEERRAVVEDVTEDELGIFDLLTKPQPALDDADREASSGPAATRARRIPPE